MQDGLLFAQRVNGGLLCCCLSTGKGVAACLRAKWHIESGASVPHLGTVRALSNCLEAHVYEHACVDAASQRASPDDRSTRGSGRCAHGQRPAKRVSSPIVQRVIVILANEAVAN